ncbi:hypothetical protein [Lysinibacillus cavernae]|uniref:hypothetical protein n=1 Tax=Lysinibacillus cavernae TaxID=2666135 RepID=UPI0012D8CFC2|nr:hypothetical protein [Lysinibacillus cavernae]
MFILKNSNRTSISNFIHQVKVAFHHFDVERCDEKTLYVSVLLKYGTHKILCDFIYIIDQQEIYGAISINKHYEKAREFVHQHFQQFLLYSDEMILAKNFMNTVSFKQCLQQFAKRYPTYISSKGHSALAIAE